MARFRIVTALLVFAIVALALSLLLVGTVDVPAVEVWRILTGRPSDYEPWNFIIFESRLPLVVTAALAGGALAVSDCCCRPCLATRSPTPRFLAYPLGQVWVPDALCLRSAARLPLYLVSPLADM